MTEKKRKNPAGFINDPPQFLLHFFNLCYNLTKHENAEECSAGRGKWNDKYITVSLIQIFSLK